MGLLPRRFLDKCCCDLRQGGKVVQLWVGARLAESGQGRGDDAKAGRELAVEELFAE